MANYIERKRANQYRRSHPEVTYCQALAIIRQRNAEAAERRQAEGPK